MPQPRFRLAAYSISWGSWWLDQAIRMGTIVAAVRIVLVSGNTARVCGFIGERIVHAAIRQRCLCP